MEGPIDQGTPSRVIREVVGEAHLEHGGLGKFSTEELKQNDAEADRKKSEGHRFYCGTQRHPENRKQPGNLGLDKLTASAPEQRHHAKHEQQECPRHN